MPRFQVLLTDYAWPEIDIERETLREIDAELIVPPDTQPATLARLATSADAIMTCWAQVSASVIDAGPRLKIVSRLGIGLDNIDVARCTQLGIPVTNVPDYCLIEVAEHTLAILLALGRNIGHYHHATQSGTYQLQSGPELRRLEGQTLGIFGYGNIGQKLAQKALALGLRVLVNSRTRRELPPGAAWAAIPELLRNSDYVSLHVPLTPETRDMISGPELAQMKPTAFLINTSRGGLVDHAALAAALAANKIAGAGLDVQVPEPPDLTQAPYNDPRVIVTPHAAFVSRESLANLRSRAARQVADRLTGKTPENVVNPQTLGAGGHS
ncbi:MAG: C-terminal binding protein [Pirellulales bacterium]|nr:C-terminal binding protein [Pirellulales bacterium]